MQPMTPQQAMRLSAAHPTNGPLLSCRGINAYPTASPMPGFVPGGLACPTCGQTLVNMPTSLRHISTPPALVAARRSGRTLA